MDAVGAHEDAAGLPPLPTQAVPQRQDHLRADLLESRRRPAALKTLRAGTPDHLVQQHHVQQAAVDRELGPAIAGCNAARLGPDMQPFLGVQAVVAGANANAVQALLQAQLAELSHCAGLQVDTHAKRTDLRHRLENLERHANLVAGQRQGESGDPAAGDENSHA